MRNTYDFDQESQWENELDFDDKLNDKNQRQKYRKREQRNNHKRMYQEELSKVLNFPAS